MLNEYELAGHQATQHLIGTQVVTSTVLAFNPESDAIVSGTAGLTSCVQAWPDRQMRLVIGDYRDHDCAQSGRERQIEQMVLAYDSGETRVPGDTP